MNVLNQAIRYFLNLDIPSRIFYFVVLFIILITVNESFYSIITSANRRTISSNLTLGLPRYSGNCPVLVAAGDQVFADSRAFEESPFKTLAEDKIAFKPIYFQLTSVFQLAQFCEDTEAQGRILYIGSSIGIGAAVRNVASLKDAVNIAVINYNQAQHIGYNDRHPNESSWLRGRIVRNAYRINKTIIVNNNTHELAIKGK